MLARLLALLLLVGISAVAPGIAEAQVIPDQYIVVLRDNTPRALDVFEHALKGFSATIPANVRAAIEWDSRVQFVSEDRVIVAFQQTVPTVLDTGIDPTHPDLQASIVCGKSCIGAPSFRDLNGHGVVGVAPGAKLWAVQVLNFLGSGTTSTIVCGIDFVDSKSPAKGGPIVVANMSLGGGGSDDGNCGNTNNDAMHKAICQAVSDGVTFVVAAGNSGANLGGCTPAAYNEVIAVTALGDSDGRACGLGAATRRSASAATRRSAAPAWPHRTWPGPPGSTSPTIPAPRRRKCWRA